MAAVSYNAKINSNFTLGVGAAFDTQKLNESTHKVSFHGRELGIELCMLVTDHSIARDAFRVRRLIYSLLTRPPFPSLSNIPKTLLTLHAFHAGFAAKCQSHSLSKRFASDTFDAAMQYSK